MSNNRVSPSSVVDHYNDHIRLASPDQLHKMARDKVVKNGTYVATVGFWTLGAIAVSATLVGAPVAVFMVYCAVKDTKNLIAFEKGLLEQRQFELRNAKVKSSAPQHNGWTAQSLTVESLPRADSVIELSDISVTMIDNPSK